MMIIKNATIQTFSDQGLLTNAVIEIRDDHIAKIGPAGEIEKSAAATVMMPPVAWLCRD